MATTVTTTDDPHLRRRRRFSTADTSRDARLPLCRRLPDSLEALDLSTASARQALGTLKVLLLSYLEDVEYRLSKLESPLSDICIGEAFKIKGDHSIEDARLWAKDALEMLRGIRSDVSSHLVELPDVPSLTDVRTHLASFSLADIHVHIDDVRSRLSDLDFYNRLSAISTRLQSFQAHLRSMDILPVDIPSLRNRSHFSGILDSIMSSELVSELADDVNAAEEMLEHAARDIARAMKRSLQGSRLIQYVDLPPQWRNNPFVIRGYRFIPLEKWPLIIMSLFAIHNETRPSFLPPRDSNAHLFTVNIHTHLIPFLLWLINCIPIFNTPRFVDIPEAAFLTFALMCLFTSVVWHTMSGCAHPEGMDLCARIDYVGIGWLISASVGTVVHYGFQCHPNIGNVFLVCCLLTGVAGNAFPFFQWFNDPAYRHLRILFFVSLAFTSAAPIAVLSYLHSPWQVKLFLDPVWPSIISYLIGLVFYATRFPERLLSERFSHYLDWCGGGSHAIWHAFIVLAIKQHREAIASLRNGVPCQATG
ncbi:hemolysin-III related-domain-containing protein [Pisolithus thermaeus]|nr:hemolysin-III related-domain-containing protein [Pisolithus thermaeus]